MTPHVLAALPLAVAAGLRLAGRPVTAAVAGVGLTAVGLVVYPALADVLDVTGAGLSARATARTLLVLVALVPWAAAVAGLVPAGRRPVPTPLVLLTAVAAALLLPPLAADRAAARELSAARAAIGRDRPALARAHLLAAVALAPDRPLVPGGPTAAAALREVEAAVARLTPAADAPLPAAAAPVERYDRAGLLLAVGRPAEAADLLRGHVEQSPRGRLRLADALADLRDWPGAAEQCRLAAEAVRPRAADPRAAAVLRQTLDGLADARAEQADRPGVEAALRDGAESLPAAAGHFRLRLGEFYRTTGRPLAALPELAAAERLDPSLAPRADAIRRHIREQTPGCLVGR